MTQKMLRSCSMGLLLLGLLIGFNQRVLAGPPLICHPFEIGNANSLPWAVGSWRATKSDYNINRLTDDTIALLGRNVPVIERMETLRRATVYAMKNPRIAKELHSRLAARARNAKGDSLALALFDIGYLEETYKQARAHLEAEIDVTTFSGYASVLRAIHLRGSDPEMEFAAAVITHHPRQSAFNEHLRKAAAGAREGSLLARNLVSHFPDRGKTLAERRRDLK